MPVIRFLTTIALVSLMALAITACGSAAPGSYSGEEGARFPPGGVSPHSVTDPYRIGSRPGLRPCSVTGQCRTRWPRWGFRPLSGAD